MNSWKFTAIIHKNIDIREEGGIITLHFTAINTEKTYDEEGNMLTEIKTSVSCTWRDPDPIYRSQWERFGDKVCVELQGRPYLRAYRRSGDGTEGTSLSCEVHKGWFESQKGRR
jgi:hypothetical protein